MPASKDQKPSPVVLMNEAALDLPLEQRIWGSDATVIVAGNSLVRMTLAELSIPGAQMIWTDFRQSASLKSLHGRIHQLGGLDRLILAADGHRAEAVFSVICAVLVFLPALRLRPGATIALSLTEGPAVASLRTFLNGLHARLAQDGTRVVLELRPAVAVPVSR